MRKFITILLMALLCVILCVGAYADDGFNAALDIEKGEDFISVTVTDSSVLQDKKPTLLINCGEEFDGAKLLFDGKASTLEYDEEKLGVSFTVAKGGTYHIVIAPTAESVVDASCTKPGSASYVYEGVEYVEELKPTGHSHSKVVTPPSCEAKGYTTYTCKCGNSYVDDKVDALDHDYILSDSKDATCTKAGYMTYICQNDSKHTYTDTIAAPGHSYSKVVTAPTCEAKGYTTYTCKCGDSYVGDKVDALGHNYKLSDSKDATCTKAGYKAYICQTDAKHTYTETIAAIGHTENAAVVENKVDATCTKDGSYDTVFYCGVCKEELSRKTTTIKAPGHRYGSTAYEWSADGKSCVAKHVCAKDATHIETATATITSKVKIAATANEKGTTTYTASFNVSWASTQTKDVQDIPATGVEDVPITPDEPVRPEIPSVDIDSPVVDTETTENEDGSTTTVEKLENGAVVETAIDAKGTVAVTAVTADGAIAAAANISDKAIEEAAKTGAAVELPMATVTNADAAVITVNTGANSDVTIEIPVSDACAGTVAILIDADGKETIITATAVSENGVTVPVADGATIKVIDNSKDFNDVKSGAWYNDAIDYTSAREIMNGVGKDNFNPSGKTTRAMVWTMLARLDGVDTSTGSTWYEAGRKWAMENGISDGTMANAEVTREQLITMIWRYLGEPEGNQDLSDYADYNSTSNWAKDAEQWAVQFGVIQGMGNNTLNPRGDATRAQVAQMFMKFLGL